MTKEEIIASARAQASAGATNSGVVPAIAWTLFEELANLLAAGGGESQSSTFDDDIEITTADKGLIVKSANGTQFKINVDNNGTLQTTQL